MDCNNVYINILNDDYYYIINIIVIYYSNIIREIKNIVAIFLISKYKQY